MILTPNPVGLMPATVKMNPDDSLGRIRLNLSAADVRMLSAHRSGAVLDRTSGERFQVNFDVDCGGGCACAAEATWLPGPVNATIEDLTTAAGTDQVFAAFRIVSMRTRVMEQVAFVSAASALQMLERSDDARRLVFRAV